MGVTRANESVRLFMVPGMMHCHDGDGTPDFDMIPELDNWVERGKAPDRVVAPRTNPDRTRPLCPYPLVAVYKGSGSTDAAESFVCGRLR
jgi:feruloyl esterase